MIEEFDFSIIITLGSDFACNQPPIRGATYEMIPKSYGTDKKKKKTTENSKILGIKSYVSYAWHSLGALVKTTFLLALYGITILYSFF